MWVSNGDFEKLKARVRELEGSSRIRVWDSFYERYELLTLERAFNLLLSALKARLTCFDCVCEVTFPSQGLKRLKGCNTLEVFSCEEVLELLLQHLQVDLVKEPAQPASAALKPKEAPNG